MGRKQPPSSPTPASLDQTLTIEEALSRAQAHWNAGQAPQAEMLCQRVLAAWPGQADALHLLGVMAHAFGNLDLGIRHLRQACLAPRAPAVYFSNLAEMCRQKGLLDEAEQVARRATALNPGSGLAKGDSRAFLDGQFGAGWNHFDQNRAIGFLGETASARYDGQQYLANALAGYDVPAGGPGDLMVTPLVGLRWLRASNGSYTETGAGAADLSVGRRTVDSLTQELGVKTSWRLATALGTLEPELKAAWVHDYRHGPIATSGVMGGETFAVTTPRIAADGARIEAAAALVHSDRLSFRAEYDGELRAGYQSHTGVLKALWQF